MSKKIFDIFPPGYRLPRVEKEIKKTIKERNKKREKEKKDKEVSQKRLQVFGRYSFIWKIIAPLLVFFILLIIVNSQAYSEITIQPFQEKRVLEGERATVSVQFDEVDLEESFIPGQFFEIEKSGSQEFSATGVSKEEGRAQGTIIVYNNYEEVINLRATTRFLSSEDGKQFQAPDRINLPAAHQENGKTVPGKAMVDIIAMGVGEDYNIGPSKFSVPGLLGNALYYQIYAESDSPMTGGFSREVKEVSNDDIEEANQGLEEQLSNQACQELETKIGDDFIFLPSAIFEREVETSCLAEAGEKKDNFTCQGTARVKVLAFKESFLRELAKDIIYEEISSNQKIIEELLSIESINAFPNQGKEEMRLDFKILAVIYNDINEDSLKSAVRGKNEELIKEVIFKSFPEVEKVKMKFWPFWIKSVPDNLDRIEINIQLDK